VLLAHDASAARIYTELHICSVGTTVRARPTVVGYAWDWETLNERLNTNAYFASPQPCRSTAEPKRVTEVYGIPAREPIQVQPAREADGVFLGVLTGWDASYRTRPRKSL
jgi:hypothetical protein